MYLATLCSYMLPSPLSLSIRCHISTQHSPPSPSGHRPYNADVSAAQTTQRIGVKLVRTWAFNYNMPAAPGNYSKAELM
jgi:hypothetical protein